MATQIRITRKENTGYKGAITYTYYINYGSYPETVKVYIDPEKQHASFYSEGNVGMRNLTGFLKAQAIAIRVVASWEKRWEQAAIAKWTNATRFAFYFSFGDSYQWDKTTGELSSISDSVLNPPKRPTFSSLMSAGNWLKETVKGQGGYTIVPLN